MILFSVKPFVMKQETQSILIILATPLRFLFFYLAAPPLLITLLLLLMIENQPITLTTWSLNQDELQRVKAVISDSREQAQTSLALSEHDLNMALSYLLNYYTRSTSEITLQKGQLNFKISLLLKKNIFGKYLNFNFNLTKQQGYPVIHTLRIGSVAIADEFAGLILESIIKYTPLKNYYVLAAQHIRDIQILEDQVNISYITQDDVDLQNELSLSDQNYQAVLFYQQKITAIVAQHDPQWRLSLAELLQPLFKEARARSSRKTAIEENRALLIAAASYVNKSEIEAYIPFNIGPVLEQEYPAFMYKRTDMAKHFMVSAVLAASGAETLADFVGLEKELEDAESGSGFSFIDLACDRAGLFLGKTSVASGKKARRLQKRMSRIRHYTDFMPDVTDLPENMTFAQFTERFGSVYDPRYQEMLKKIDERISALEIYN